MLSRVRCAVAAILEVARHNSQKPVPLRVISASQCISLSYLEPMFSSFRSHELVRSKQGARGGYSLARPAGKINVADIVRSINEDIFQLPKNLNTNLPLHATTIDIWTSANREALNFFETVTLESLLHAKRGSAITPNNSMAFRGILYRTNKNSLPDHVINSVFALGQREPNEA